MSVCGYITPGSSVDWGVPGGLGAAATAADMMGCVSREEMHGDGREGRSEQPTLSFGVVVLRSR